VGPLAFALGALTSLLLLNQVAKRFGDLAGKGLPWSVIAEFFGLAVPFIVAMTLPMAVLVATLYAFSRLASENEITALKASGVSMKRVLTPVLIAAFGVTVAMLLFNDQVMPRTNHQLAILQRDIAQKKPTLALREQVINEITPGRFYLRAGHLDEKSNRMREITIYDFADPARKRTIYADSGNLAMSPDQTDLLLTLHDGTLHDVPTERPAELQRLNFQTDFIRVRGVGNEFRKSETETFKGEREMTLCEMTAAHLSARNQYARAADEFRTAMHRAVEGGVDPGEDAQRVRLQNTKDRTFGDVYCSAVTAVGAGIQRIVYAVRGTPMAPLQADARTSQLTDTAFSATEEARMPPGRARIAGMAADVTDSVLPPGTLPSGDPAEIIDLPVRATVIPVIEDARLRLNDNTRLMNLYAIEIHKKAALAVACFVFVLLGAPIAVRFPRGGVGLVIGVSIIVFGLYYVALIGGQSLGQRGLVPPAAAMWGANVLFGTVGILLLARMGRESHTSRGGDAREMLENLRSWSARQAARVGIRMERRRRYR
jgi:lipopolysaccharide export system permease protein